jgi:hypothetical protein
LALGLELDEQPIQAGIQGDVSTQRLPLALGLAAGQCKIRQREVQTNKQYA